ncbi:MAG: LPS export ABC transporter periplasmic protein LptC [Acidobacteriota bacterium]|nr:LPS export ABC transporter periplasmic protein LptC [Acidobacteriota bacterium]
MRSLRWLLLVAMVLIAAAVSGLYRSQRAARRGQRRSTPASVPLDTKTMAPDWEWSQSSNGLPAVKVKAKQMTQSADGTKVQLEQIELQLYTKDGRHYDRVRSAWAQMTTSDHKLFSPGDAEITLEVPVKGEPSHRLTSITASGINFDSQSGQAVTDRHVSFTFEEGDGACDGATYDPTTHALDLTSNVVVNLRGKGPKSKPMKVESGHLSWNEKTGMLMLTPWSRLTRDQTVVEAAQSTVVLNGRDVDWIDAVNGHGTDKQPARQIAYSADMIHLKYNEDHEIQQVTGTGNAKLVAHGTASDTTITGDRVDLNFTDHEGESVLSQATASGHGYLESKPRPDAKGQTGDTKILKSDILSLQMKEGGKDLERVNTQSPGTLEFLPNQPARHRRVLHAAEQMTILYGPKNEIQSFHAGGASTETYPSQEELKKKKTGLATSFTSSKTIDASFDDKGELKFMKQTDNFRYTEGDRKAQADSASLENNTNVMDLEKNARIADATGSTAGDHIRLNQTTGDFDATGHVATTRLPDNQKSASAILDKDEPTLGTADHVVSANRNHLIHYSGNAVVWQTSNRIQADKIDIDRDRKSLIADGKVVTQFEDKPKPDEPVDASRPLQPLFTIVKAPHMVYSDKDRLADYTGGVNFWRPSLTITSNALKAFLNPQDSDADSRINHALGDGKVEIVQFGDDRQRVGHSEHAEYYTADGKVVLTGGQPKLDDSKRGNTQGEKLTYYTDNKRLDVDGSAEHKGQSHIRRKI